MKKNKLFNTLAKKYNLPKQYITFKLSKFYFYKASVEVSAEWCKSFEEMFNWGFIKEDFEKDRNREESIFYGM